MVIRWFLWSTEFCTTAVREELLYTSKFPGTMIKSVIVDDELPCIDTLSILLHKNCPQVEIINTYTSARDTLEGLRKSVPDLLFLDIEMPVINGFQMLELLPSIPFAIVFTTSYDQYAIRAIRFSALDFLNRSMRMNWWML
jgi:two-component system, LytTR family, response regulator